MTYNNLPIGFFDSGVGGVSVLAEASLVLPNESLIFLGDSAHNPYGTKDVAEVKHLSIQAADYLIKEGIKALVVACNTATSVAVNDLRQSLNIPVLGVEPALKPAVERAGQGDIVVMATPITLREKKFQALLSLYREKRNIILLPCPGLAELIEKGNYIGPVIREYLINIFAHIKKERVSAIVLGCTHYIFIKKEIKNLMPHVQLIDGNRGTVNNLKRILEQKGLIADPDRRDKEIKYFSTGDPVQFSALCEELFNFYIGS